MFCRKNPGTLGTRGTSDLTIKTFSSVKTRVLYDLMISKWPHLNIKKNFNPFIFANRCRRPLIFQAKNFFRSNSTFLKFKCFSPSGRKDIGIKKVQFLFLIKNFKTGNQNNNVVNIYQRKLI